MSSQGGNFYVGTSSDAYATTSISTLTITNTGNVGIATSSPQSALLSVENTGTGYTFYATDSANDTTPFVIDASGNVGVGTANPTVLLDIEKSGVNDPLVQLGGTSATDAPSFLIKNGAGDIRFAIAGSSGQYANNSAQGDIVIRYNSAHNLIFSAGATERLNVTTTGNVGIGTTSPYTKLSVVGETVSTYFTATSTTATSTFLGAVGVGTSTPAEQLSVSGRIFVGGTGTSTIQNNLYVMGTLRSTVSYVGDLIFSNNFKFIETPLNAKVQSLFLQNQYGEDIFKINENGKLVVKEIEAQNINSQNIKSKQGNFEEKLCIKNTCISEKELKELLQLRKRNNEN